jgi:hypothetical protein
MTLTRNSGAIFPWFSSTTVTVLATVLLVGCVNLDKPESVRNCAGTPQGCSDEPTSTSKSDASDGQKGSPDVKLEDGNATPDVVPGSPDAGPDRFSSPDVADAIVRRDSAPVEIDGGAVDGQGADLPFDLPVSADGPSFDEGSELDVGKADLPTPDTADAIADLPSADVTVDVTFLDATPDVQLNCVEQIVSSGYKAGTAAPCSECYDNKTPMVKQCTGMLDCLAPKSAPRSSSTILQCLNQVGGSGVVSDCVTVLLKAGCPNGY